MILKKITSGVVACLILIGCGPAIDVMDSENRPVRFADYQGQRVLIQYWADWCHTCVKEIPELNALADQDVQVFGVHAENKTREALNEYRQKFGIEYPILQSDPKTILALADVSGVPALYFLDPTGKIHGPLLGSQTKESILAWMDSQAV